MSSQQVTIFFTGATGFIGSSVLQRLIDHPQRKNFEITALVRNADKAKILETDYGLKTVVGSLQDLEKLSTLSENAHVVIHTADCDDMAAIKAILSGLKARHEKTGDLPLLIHTSGTGELMDDAQGAYASEKIYSDLDLASIEALSPTAIHRPVDLTIVAADEAGYVRTHIIMPSVVFGVATNKIAAAGLANAHTILIPLYVRSALHNGTVGILNKGAAIWGYVYIEDIAELYIGMLDALLTTPEKVSHGREGYFFGAAGELSTGTTLKALAQALFDLGLTKSPEPSYYNLEQMAQYFESVPGAGFDRGVFSGQLIARALFANTRSKAERATRDFGWAPKHTTDDFFAGLKAEVEILAKKAKSA
ncbi:NAD-P-binding protein [Lenzites betulinus]|nr:NAD-P-binding protein [Lenzites betulinus]